MCIRCAREYGDALLPSVQTGLVFGIFDKTYQFRRPESQLTGGAVYFSEFDEDDPKIEIGGRQRLSEAMDFPLVSYASSYDGGDPRPGRLSFGDRSSAMARRCGGHGSNAPKYVRRRD